MVIYIRELRDRAAAGALSRNRRRRRCRPASCRSEQQGFRVETVVDGLENPWDVEILPDGALLVPERSGRLRIFRNGVAGAADHRPAADLGAAGRRPDGHRACTPTTRRPAGSTWRSARPAAPPRARRRRASSAARIKDGALDRAADAVPGARRISTGPTTPTSGRASSSTRTSTSTTRSAIAATSTRRRI